MIPKQGAKVAKGIMFAGCSFTWGQGLYYYSNLPTIQEPLPDHYDPNLVTRAHHEYKKRCRYPRLVADHFDTWEVVHPMNGGSNQSAIKWFRSWLLNGGWKVISNAGDDWEYNLDYINYNPDNPDPGCPPKTYDFTELSYVFLQLTQSHRNNFMFTFDNTDYNVPLAEIRGNLEINKVFLNYLHSKDMDIDQWLEQYMQDNLNEVKQFLELCERKGVKTGFITWPNEYIPYIQKDQWLLDRFISLEYKDEKFDSIEDLMKKHRECEIKHDYENFTETPKDHHPSKTCHKVMADAIIKYIENKGYP